MKFLLSVLMVLGCNSVDAVRNTNIDYSNRSGKILAFNREHNKSFLRSFVEGVQGLGKGVQILGKETASCIGREAVLCSNELSNMSPLRRMTITFLMAYKLVTLIDHSFDNGGQMYEFLFKW